VSLPSLRWLVLVVLALLTSPAAAAGEPVGAAPAPADDGAKVVVLNRQITVLRATLLGVGPRDRARRASEWVSELIDRPGAAKVTVAHEGVGNALMIDGTLGFAITPGDLRPLGGETLEVATASAKNALERAVAETREAHDKRRLLQALGRVAIAAAVLLLIVGLTLRTRRWLTVRFAHAMRDSASRVRLGGTRLLYAQRLVGLSRWLVRTLSTLVIALALYRFTSYALNQFPYSRAWGEHLDDFLLGVAQKLGGDMVRALPNAVVAVAILLVARVVVRGLAPFFDTVERGSLDLGWLDADTVKPTRRLVTAGVYLFALAMAYPYLPGSSSEAFKGLSLLLGLMISLGGASLFGQAASGLILMYSRTLRVGEHVFIAEHEGTVTDVGSFTVKLATGIGEELTLPNSLVLANVTRNYSRPQRGRGFILHTQVSIGYDTPWRQVDAMLLEAARRTPGVDADPPPAVFHTVLADFYVEYRLVCHGTQRDARERARALHALNGNVLDVFNEHGVQIMSPHYFGDPAAAKVVAPSKWRPAPVDDGTPST
jgi:small-conductance mechanosensitive channel